MKLLLLSLLLVFHQSVGLAMPATTPPRGAKIPPHAIVEYIDRSQAMNWTIGTVEDTGATYTMAAIDIETWNAAAVALGDRFSTSTDNAPNDVATAGSRFDKFYYSARCYHDGVEVRFQDFVKIFPVLQKYIKEKGTTEAYSWGFDHPTDPDITLWYIISIFQWREEVPDGLIKHAFDMLLQASCGRPEAYRGGLMNVGDNKLYESVASVEFYASTR